MPDEKRHERSYTPKRSKRKHRRRRTSTPDDESRTSDNEKSYTPKRPKHARRRRSSTPADAGETSGKRSRSGLSANELLKIVSALQGVSSKNTSTNNVVPEFDPNNRAQDVERWIKKVNECAVIYSWDEKQTIHYAIQKLRGLAKSWYESLPTLSYSWDVWQSKLMKAFPNDVNYGKLLDEMLNRRSRTDETLRDYFYEKLALLSRCEIVGRKAVECIIYGINDSSVRNGAQALKCEEPEDLLNYLASQQPSQSRDASRGPLASNTSKRRDFRNNPTDKSTASSRGVDSSSCFNCQERGHIYQNCPKPIVKCGKCLRVGHNFENCTRRPLQTQTRENRETSSSSVQTTDKKVLKVVVDVDNLISDVETRTTLDIKSPVGLSSQAQPHSDSVDESVNEKFYKTICVNGQMLDAYIDFGCALSLIRYSDAIALKLIESGDKPLPTLRGFGHGAVVPRAEATVHVRIDEIETELNVLAVDDTYLESPLMIGRDFTELPSVTALKNNKQLFFYHTPSEINEDQNQTFGLYISKDVTVVKGGLVEVYTKETYTGNVYSDGGTRMSPNQEYHLHQGYYEVKESRAVVFITSLTKAPLNFRAGTLLARVNPIAEVKALAIQVEYDEMEMKPVERTEIRVGKGVDEKTRERLHQLIQKYRSCFAKNLNELGCTKDAIMNIDLHDKTPVVYRPYRLSHPERQKVRDIVDELVKNDIAQESNSNYASPILLVQKKNGESRLCVDYRALNNKTVKDKYPLPLIDDQLSNLSGNKYFITLDLASGYYQIPVGEDSRHLTAFVTPDGHYEFKRMPFGLANAPAVFQKMMNGLLGSRRFKSALAYMDDLLIPSASIDEGFERLEDVLKLIQDAGLTLKLSKCSFFDTSIEYLGYEISSEGIRPSEKKILAVRDFPVPRNVHEIRQFLGLASYFRRFVRGFGEIARPLTTLLKKDMQWQWGDDEVKSFEALKQCLIRRPLLALYNPELDTEVHADASSLGLGGILMQWQLSPRVLKPVAYFSRQTTPEERHFHSYELETLAVVCSLKKFRPYLLGLNFTVYTDCNALRTTLTKRDLIPRIARWWLTISEYNFNIEYRPGCRMSHVDALSRNPPQDSGTSLSATVLHINTDNWILTLQMADSRLERIFKFLKPGLDREVSDVKDNFVIKNHALHRKTKDGLRLVVPKDARWQICKANHDDVGHFGYVKTLERIQNRYWFPKLRRFVKKYVAACIDCAYNKDNAARTSTGFLHPIEKVVQPFHTLHLDHLGPFVKSKAGNSYILTIVDGFTKYVFARPVKDTKTKNVVKVLDSLFNDFMIPRRIVSDRGTAFTSGQFKEFCINKGIKHVLNAVACPRANGQAERFNQTILTALSTQNFENNERDWDKRLGQVQWGINNTVNATTKKSPSELLFGVKSNCPIDNKLSAETDAVANLEEMSSIVAVRGTSNDEVPVDEILDIGQGITSCSRDSASDNVVELAPSSIETNKRVDEIRQEASANIKHSQERQKQLYDSKRVPSVLYSVGDLVKLTKTSFYNNGKSKKLMPKFIGPYKVTSCLGNDRYRVSNVPGFNTKKYDSVIASDRMRPWISVQALQVNGSSGSESSDSDDSISE